ncbi:MAG: fatty acid desaturase [Planctomycetota bacterium]
MKAKRLGKTQNSKALHEEILHLRSLDNYTNLVYLAIDYITMFAIAAFAVAFFELREQWNLAWGWNIPVAAVAILLMGGVQHRLAGLGHEAAHYALLKNRLANDLVSDLFCMFPIYATTQQYRLVHLAHHQFTNDWERDPDLLNIGKSKLMDQFPMNRWQFIYNYYIRFFMPHVLLRYLWDIVYLSAFGKGISPFEKDKHSNDQPNKVNVNLRWTSVLGLGYFFGLAFLLNYLNRIGAGALVGLVPLTAFVIAGTITALLPEKAFFVSPLKSVYSVRTTNVLRLGYYTAFLTAFAGLRYYTGQNWGPYFLLLWVVPLVTSFAYFMVLRDVYQHANADDGKFTNSRVFFCDPFTWWAVFVYGQDMHIPHHLYPAVPHYNLLKLHRVLQERDPEYAEHVVECHGVLQNDMDKPSILDVMHTPTTESTPQTHPAQESSRRMHMNLNAAPTQEGSRSLAQ